MIVSIYGQSCTCTCGTSTYYPTFNCSSADICAIKCNSNYSTCTDSNTYGCCDNTCIYYTSTIICNCLCSNLHRGLVHSVGTVPTNSCTTDSCKQACSSTYPSSCGRYTNQAYCTTNAMIRHQVISMFTIIFNLSALYFGSKCFNI